MEKPLPNSIKTTWEEFLLNYDDGTMEIPHQKLSHVSWMGREEVLKDISAVQDMKQAKTFPTEYG